MLELSSNIKFLIKDGKSLSNFGKLVKHSVHTHASGKTSLCPSSNSPQVVPHCMQEQNESPVAKTAGHPPPPCNKQHRRCVYFAQSLGLSLSLMVSVTSMSQLVTSCHSDCYSQSTHTQLSQLKQILCCKIRGLRGPGCTPVLHLPSRCACCPTAATAMQRRKEASLSSPRSVAV